MEVNYFTTLYWFCHTSTWIRHKCTHKNNRAWNNANMKVKILLSISMCSIIIIRAIDTFTGFPHSECRLNLPTHFKLDVVMWLILANEMWPSMSLPFPSRLVTTVINHPWSGSKWWAFLMVQCVKNLPAMQETQEIQIPPLGSEDPPEGENGSPLQYSCLENPMDRGAWRATVQRVAKSQTQLSN